MPHLLINPLQYLIQALGILHCERMLGRRSIHYDFYVHAVECESVFGHWAYLPWGFRPTRVYITPPLRRICGGRLRPIVAPLDLQESYTIVSTRLPV